MSKISQIILLSCVALLLSGCATNITGQLTPLSGVFELKQVVGGVGIWKWKRNDIFVRKENGKLKYIGTVEVSSPDFIKSFGAGGLEHRVLAISIDGRSIVFDHWGGNAPSKAGMKSGIYSYRYGEEPKRIINPKTMSTAIWTRWPKPLPKNILPFSYRPVTYTPEDMFWAIRADDIAQFPLALLEAKPIHQCAFDGDIPTCRTLLRKGANINVGTYWGFTPLDLSIIRGHEDLAIYLLENGANPDAGIYPAFHRAVMLGRMRVVKVMLERGVDVNKLDKAGNTPLHLAVYAGRRLVGDMHPFFEGTETPRSIIDKNITTELVKMLLEYGANPHVKNKSGKYPIEEAGKYTPRETKKLLLRYVE